MLRLKLEKIEVGAKVLMYFRFSVIQTGLKFHVQAQIYTYVQN